MIVPGDVAIKSTLIEVVYAPSAYDLQFWTEWEKTIKRFRYLYYRQSQKNRNIFEVPCLLEKSVYQ